MSYSSAEGRTRILADTAAAVEVLASAMASVGEAYEHLDERSGEQVEEQLFRPLQGAYAHLRRAHAAFAGRVGLAAVVAGTPVVPAPTGAGQALGQAAEAVTEADQLIAELQDSLLPVEVGDRELRADLAAVRTALAPLPEACASVIRTLGR